MRHIIIKMTWFKDKERILKAAREKQVVTYKGAPIKLASEFSTETFQDRRQWCEICKVMKSKELQPRLLYPAKLTFKIKGEITSFPDKKKLFINQSYGISYCHSYPNPLNQYCKTTSTSKKD